MRSIPARAAAGARRSASVGSLASAGRRSGDRRRCRSATATVRRAGSRPAARRRAAASGDRRQRKPARRWKPARFARSQLQVMQLGTRCVQASERCARRHRARMCVQQREHSRAIESGDGRELHANACPPAEASRVCAKAKTGRAPCRPCSTAARRRGRPRVPSRRDRGRGIARGRSRAVSVASGHGTATGQDLAHPERRLVVAARPARASSAPFGHIRSARRAWRMRGGRDRPRAERARPQQHVVSSA